MHWNNKPGLVATLMVAALLACESGPAVAAINIDGRVQAGGSAVAGSTVSLWAASANAPLRLTQATTGADGSFVVSVDQTPDGAILYLVATGGTPSANKQGGENPALVLLAVLVGGRAAARIARS